MACDCVSYEREIFEAVGKSLLVRNTFATTLTLRTSATSLNQVLKGKIEIPCALALPGGSSKIVQATIAECASSSGDLKKKGLTLYFLEASC